MGRAVSANVRRLRDAAGLAKEDLARLVIGTGLSPGGGEWNQLKITRIENGRRVDADELAALAAALGVSPITLLLPPGAEREDIVADGVTAEQWWEWLRAAGPLGAKAGERGGQELLEFFARALPSWVVVDLANAAAAAQRQRDSRS